MRVAAAHASCLLAALLGSACSDSVDRGRARDTEPPAGDAALPEDAGSINDSLGTCRTSCDAPLLLGTIGQFELEDRIHAVLSAARVGDTLGVLVIRGREFDASRLWNAYALLRFDLRTGEAELGQPVEEFLVDDAMMGGTLVARDDHFQGILLRSEERARHGGPTSVGRVRWSSSGELLGVDDLGALTQELEACQCARVGAAFADDDSAVVGVGYGDGVEGGLVDFADGRLEALGPMVTFAGERRETIPLSGVVLAHDGSGIAVVGGGARPLSYPTRAFAAWGTLGGSPLVAIPLPGDEADPAPRVTQVGGTPIAWRFVSSADDTMQGAVVGWRLSESAPNEIARVTTPAGLFPTTLAVGSMGQRATIVWGEATGILGANIRVVVADGGICTTTLAHTALAVPSIPSTQLPLGSGDLVAAPDDVGTFVITLGAEGQFVVSAFLVPGCQVTRSAR